MAKTTIKIYNRNGLLDEKQYQNLTYIKVNGRLVWQQKGIENGKDKRRE